MKTKLTLKNITSEDLGIHARYDLLIMPDGKVNPRALLLLAHAVQFTPSTNDHAGTVMSSHCEVCYFVGLAIRGLISADVCLYLLSLFVSPQGNDRVNIADELADAGWSDKATTNKTLEEFIIINGVFVAFWYRPFHALVHTVPAVVSRLEAGYTELSAMLEGVA